VVIDGPQTILEIQNISFDSLPINISLYKSKPTAFIGIDLNKKPGVYVLSVTLSNGQVINKNITVNAREKIQAPLGIPTKLGGNTPSSQKSLVSSLANENDILSKLTTNKKMLWTNKFSFPISNPIMTDPYGYLRQTGSYSIAHKGTDFRALEGTPVVAMNRGVVRLIKVFHTYGKTVIIDHGLGIMTFYMHLSKISVNQGELVQQGQGIGLSGQTGYAEVPHLHITIRINNISIDPMKFMNFFQ
jgi:murein DD-endopeptidase MepM/ murein hydrolase activator NlpD